jgi:single-strand DNA-binding protein
MGASYNKVELIGRLGDDATVRYTGSGTKVAELRIATSYGSGDKEQTEWHRVICWDKLADVAEAYTSKGGLIHISGRLQTRTFDDKEGVKRYITEIVAERLTLLSKASDAGEKKAKTKSTKKTANKNVEDNGEEDLPF